MSTVNGCIGVFSRETLTSVVCSHRVRLSEPLTNIFWGLGCRVVRALRSDNEKHIQGICEEVERQLHTSDSQIAYSEITMLSGRR